ncbi:MAG: PEGA domain-containing protein [Candidatus Saccharimonas sp.]
MHKRKSKLRERTELVFIYTAMIAAIAIILSSLVLVVQGYRFNQYDGKIEQGGLVQFGSLPTGANVVVDNVQLSSKTNSKITLSSGDHEITYSRLGYSDWKKSVTVEPGTILWLTYARMFPTQPVTAIIDGGEPVTSEAISPNQTWLAYIRNPSVPDISLVNISDTTPQVTHVAIPEASYTVASDATSQRFKLLSWDKDSQTVLVEHDYNDTSEYLVLSMRGSNTAYNVSTELGLKIKKIEFSSGDSNVLYAQTSANDLRRINISSSTISGPLVTNISDFTASGQVVITYVTLANKDGIRQVGYVSGGSSVAKVIASYVLGDDVPIHAAIGDYFNERYIALSHGMAVDVSTTGSLPSSDSISILNLKPVTQMLLGDNADYLGFSPSDKRMVYAQYGGNRVSTYDLELGLSSIVTMPSSLTREIDWLDDFHISATIDGSVSYYDYDGTNGQMVATGVTNLPLVVEGNNKYMYYFTTSDTGNSLTRVSLLPQ